MIIKRIVALEKLCYLLFLFYKEKIEDLRNIEEDSYIQKVEKRMCEKDYPDKLYHYTSAEALFGIFTKQELWFSNPLMLNDREECFYFPRELKKALEESCPQSIIRIEEFFEKVFNEIEKEPFYIMCFSKLKDDAAQWDRYSNKGKGFCIEFDTKALLLLFGTKWIQLWPVCYDLEVRKHPLFEILNAFQESSRKGVSTAFNVSLKVVSFLAKWTSSKSESKSGNGRFL